jgi:hypothetical protein
MILLWLKIRFIETFSQDIVVDAVMRVLTHHSFFICYSVAWGDNGASSLIMDTNPGEGTLLTTGEDTR